MIHSPASASLSTRRRSAASSRLGTFPFIFVGGFVQLLLETPDVATVKKRRS
jgi:hypothetical protein